MPEILKKTFSYKNYSANESLKNEDNMGLCLPRNVLRDAF